MSRTFNAIERALNAEFKRVERENPSQELKMAIETSTIRKVIRDILSLPPLAKVPGTADEHRILEQVICLVSFYNRKWLSEIQVAIPHSRFTSKTRPSEAKLKSKVPLRTKPVGDRAPAMSDIELRNYFLHLLLTCVPEEERKAFPHLLSLYNSNEDTSETADKLQVVMESGAWLVLSKCQGHIYDAERGSRPRPRPESQTPRHSIRDFSLEEIQSIHEEILESMSHSVPRSRWYSDLIATTPSQDGLFAKLLINAALNRFILENWAFEHRTHAVADVHRDFLSELEQTVPQGLLGILDDYRLNGEICHGALAKYVLKGSMSKRTNALTDSVMKALNAQAEAVLASASNAEYGAEVEVNHAILRSHELSRAMIWLALAWIYLNDRRLPDDNPNLHVTGFRPISRRARATEIGQNMVSLRRVLSTLMLGHHYDYPSAARSILHARWVINVRRILIRTLLGNFKQAALSKWDSVLMSQCSEDQVAQLLERCGLPPRPCVQLQGIVGGPGHSSHASCESL